jgi:hypothetical protein
MNMITTPSLQQILINNPPLDIANGAIAEWTLNSIRHTAHVADDIHASHPCTLADALAQLSQMESFVLDSSAKVQASISDLGASLAKLSGGIDILKAHTNAWWRLPKQLQLI